MPDGEKMSMDVKDVVSSAEKEALSLNTPEYVAAVKIEDAVLPEDLTDETGVQKNNTMLSFDNLESPERIADVVQMSDAEKASVTNEDAILSTGEEQTSDLKVHSKEKPYSCTYCSASFGRKSWLDRHLQTHSGEKPFCCTHCCSNFSRKSDLSRHLLVHSSEKPLFCTYCSSNFRRKSDLQRHLRIHSREKQFCCTFCHANFFRKYDLQRHLQTHSSEKPFCCTYCPAKFNQNYNLKRHVLIHFDQKPFECSICGAKFRLKAKLKDHLNTHEARKPYNCTFCPAEFSVNSSLNRHLKTHTQEKVKEKVSSFTSAVTEVSVNDNDSEISNPVHHFNPRKDQTEEVKIVSTAINSMHDPSSEEPSYTNSSSVLQVENDVPSVKKEASSLGTSECVAVIKVENVVLTEAGTEEAGTPTCVCETEKDQMRVIKTEKADINSTYNPTLDQCLPSNSYVFAGRNATLEESCEQIENTSLSFGELEPAVYFDAEEVSVKNEEAFSSCGEEEALSFNSTEFVADVKVEKESPSEGETSEFGDPVPYFEAEIDEIGGIKTESLDVNFIETPSPNEYSACGTKSSSVFANSDVTIKEEDNSEEMEKLTPRNQEHTMHDLDSSQSATFDDKLTDSFAWGLLREDNSGSCPASVDDLLCESKNFEGHSLAPGFEHTQDLAVMESSKSRPIIGKSLSSTECGDLNCQYCPAHFSRKNFLTRHLRIHRKEKSDIDHRPHLCTLCPSEFSSIGTLMLHAKVHSEERPNICTHCPANFCKASDSKRHFQTHSSEKPFCCTLCASNFSRKSNLQIHSSEKTYRCTLCSASFIRSSDLQRHLRTHSSEKPFCCTYCPAKFNGDHNLKRHVLIHLNQKPFECTICDAKFRLKEKLKDHLNMHSEQKPYNFTFCPAEFSASSSLNRHLNTHVQEKIGGKVSNFTLAASEEISAQDMNGKTDNSAYDFENGKEQSEEIKLASIYTNSTGDVSPEEASYTSSSSIFQVINEVSSVKKETSSPVTTESVVAIEEGNEVLTKSGIVEAGNRACFLETEKNETREIKTERTEINSTDNTSLDECLLPDTSSSVFVERSAIIKGEVFDVEEKAVETSDRSVSKLSSENEEVFVDDKSFQSTSLCNTVNETSAWGLCEEDLSHSSTIEGNAKQRKSRAYYYSHGFKLAHLSVVLLDLKHQAPTATNPFSCPHCCAKFGRKSHLQDHQSIHSRPNKKEISCTLCQAKFWYSSSLNRHMKIHRQEKPFSCSDCHAKFREKISLNRHLKVHTKEKPHLCTYCCSKFREKWDLDRHLRIHTLEKPFCCTYCPAKFTQNSHLSTHVKIHTNEQAFSCHLCDSRFRRKDHLQDHLSSHSNQKPFSCSLCPVKFKRLRYLKIHLKRHAEEKPFCCVICRVKFSQDIDLKRHLRIHTGERPYLCAECPANFRRKSHLRVHLKIHTYSSKTCEERSQELFFTNEEIVKEEC